MNFFFCNSYVTVSYTSSLNLKINFYILVQETIFYVKIVIRTIFLCERQTLSRHYTKLLILCAFFYWIVSFLWDFAIFYTFSNIFLLVKSVKTIGSKNWSFRELFKHIWNIFEMCIRFQSELWPNSLFQRIIL